MVLGMWKQKLGELFGSTYTRAYWCLFPPSAKDNVVPDLQDCHDHLMDRLGELQEREKTLAMEMRMLKNKRDRTRLRRLFIEHRDVNKDIAVTENTIFTVEKQLNLIGRRELDNLVVGALHSSVSVLNNMHQDVPTVDEVEELTSTLQDRMQEVNAVNDSVSAALERGLDDDFSNLEEELDAFLKEPEDTKEEETDNEMSTIPLKHVEVPSRVRPHVVKYNLPTRKPIDSPMTSPRGNQESEMLLTS